MYTYNYLNNKRYLQNRLKKLCDITFDPVFCALTVIAKYHCYCEFSITVLLTFFRVLKVVELYF